MYGEQSLQDLVFLMIYGGAGMLALGPCTAQDLAQQSGFSSYSTFSAAFKRFMNLSVASWMKTEEEKEA